VVTDFGIAPYLSRDLKLPIRIDSATDARAPGHVDQILISLSRAQAASPASEASDIVL